MSKLTKRHFWEWFKRHNKEYMELNKKPKKEMRYLMNELNAHLRAYFKFLEFSITIHEDGNATLTISVNGKPNHFKRAEDFVATAPELAGWRITALDDPRPIDFSVEDESIDPREFYFSFECDAPDASAIIIYHPLCTDENRRMLTMVACTAVYNLLGERSFGMDIEILEVANLSAAGSGEVFGLAALPGCVGMRRSSFTVDSKGRLGQACNCP